MGSIKNFDIDELERAKKENEKRLKELERIYMSKKENSGVGKVIRDRMGLHSDDEKPTVEDSPRGEDFDREEEELPAKKKKSVKIADGKENHSANKLRSSAPGLPRASSAKGPPASILTGARNLSPSSR